MGLFERDDFSERAIKAGLSYEEFARSEVRRINTGIRKPKIKKTNFPQTWVDSLNECLVVANDKADWLHCNQQLQATDPPTPTMSGIIQEVAKKYGECPKQIRGEKRYASLIQPRHESIFRVAKELPFNHTKIGRFFSHRDHSTIYYAIQRYRDLQIAKATGDFSKFKQRNVKVREDLIIPLEGAP